AAQVRRVLVHGVVQRRRGRLDAPTGFLAYRGITAQRARHRGLGNPGLFGDVERRNALLALHAMTAFGPGDGSIEGYDASQIRARLPGWSAQPGGFPSASDAKIAP